MPKLFVSTLAAGVVGVALLLAAAAPAGERSSRSGPAESTKRCKAGLKHAVIGGKHACLKVGQPLQAPAR